MTLLHTTMLMLTASCALMLIGFSARESRWGPALMMVGIVGALLQRSSWASVANWGWRAAFVIGMVAAPLVWQLIAPLPPMEMPSNPLVIVLAGLLVGFGTRLGSGCTSGHGVCGLSRLSLRSLAATLTFIGAGAATVFVVRHVLA